MTEQDALFPGPDYNPYIFYASLNTTAVLCPRALRGRCHQAEKSFFFVPSHLRLGFIERYRVNIRVARIKSDDNKEDKWPRMVRPLVLKCLPPARSHPYTSHNRLTAIGTTAQGYKCTGMGA
jgi:hypothetical protein